MSVVRSPFKISQLATLSGSDFVETRALLGLFFSSYLVEFAYHAASFVTISVLTSIYLAHYQATLVKVRVRKSSVLIGRYIHIRVRGAYVLIIIFSNSIKVSYSQEFAHYLATVFRSAFIKLQDHADTYVFISVLRSIELAHYLASFYRSGFVELAYCAASFVTISVLTSIQLAYYLATLLKVRVRKSRVLLGHFMKILILLRIRALLGHYFQDRIH